MPHITEAPSAPARELTPFSYTIKGSFAPNGASAIDQASNRGDQLRWSVARAAQGEYDVTLADNINAITAVTAVVQLAAAAARYIQIGAVNTAARTVRIRVVDASGVAQDVAADANNRINFQITVRGTDRARF